MGLGAGELVLILVIAYVVVGPEDMSKLVRTAAKYMRQLRKMGTDLRADVEDGLDLPELSPVSEIVSPAGRKTDPVAAARSVSDDLDSVLKEIEKTEEQLKAVKG